MAVDLTTGSYDEAGIFNKYNAIVQPDDKSKNEESTHSLRNFTVKRILKERSTTKSVVVEGLFTNDDRPAIIAIEKIPFDTRDLSQLLSSDTRLELKFWNSIYGNYHVLFPNGFNGIGVQVIHPATKEDFAKFEEEPEVMVTETPELYDSVVLPYLRRQEGSTHSFDRGRIIFCDSDKDPNFILVDEELEQCRCTSKHFRALVTFVRNDWLSLRDLQVEHIPFLLKVQNKCREVLSAKYEVPTSKIEAYVTYPPTIPTFHIIFETVEKDCMIPAEKAHSLDTIISNMTVIPLYYKKSTLIYSLPEQHPIAQTLVGRKMHSNDNNVS